MPLVRLSVENYRCFSKRQELELPSITVVLGKNNSGKSALVRAPLVLSTGIRGESTLPLDLGMLGDDAPEFVDLVHRRLEHGNVTLSYEFVVGSEPPVRLQVTVQNIAEWHTQLVSRWHLRVGDTTAELEWLSNEAFADPDGQVYRLTLPGIAEQVVMQRFEGLFPDVAGPEWRTFRIGMDRIRAGFDQIRLMGPFRVRPSRFGRVPARAPEEDGELGRNTAATLIHDHVRRGGRLLAKVNEYLSAHLPGWELEVVPRYDAYSVGLKSTVTRGLWVPATDTGTGVAQVLPILVRRAQDELDPPGRDILEIVEEPELHLHPSAQASLADLYLAAAKKTSVRFLIETHSETFLLRLRRRVAEGGLDPGMLALYFVESTGDTATARRINVDSLGNVDYWPQGIFAEDFEETRALLAAQLDRQGPNAR
nr:DUF3696 domain-containing protein [Sphaerisporangium rubeum]